MEQVGTMSHAGFKSLSTGLIERYRGILLLPQEGELDLEALECQEGGEEEGAGVEAGDDGLAYLGGEVILYPFTRHGINRIPLPID